MNKNEYGQDHRIITFVTLRKAIGWLGILLPLALIIGTIVIGRCQNVQDSISHYYYTVMGGVFVGTLCAVALFLIIYRGYNWLDNLSTTVAGFCAIGVAMFPTSSNKDKICSIIDFGNLGPIETLHYLSAALFFLTLAFISIFLFRKGSADPTPRKKTRNKIYLISGIVIIACMVLILILHSLPALEKIVNLYKLVFVLEWIALLAFGISWLVKGDLIFFRDRAKLSVESS